MNTQHLAIAKKPILYNLNGFDGKYQKNSQKKLYFLCSLCAVIPLDFIHKSDQWKVYTALNLLAEELIELSWPEIKTRVNTLLN